MERIYDPKFVEALFDKMSNSYSKMNYITSFGFSERWRRQCVAAIGIEAGKTTVDLMTGMGECWKYILKTADKDSTLIGIDFSSEMIDRAKMNQKNYNDHNIKVLKENIFDNSIAAHTVDYVISGFGLKTFDTKQLEKLAYEINRMLKVGGTFSLIDVSIPGAKLLRPFYMFYLKKIIPVLGLLFLGNPNTYKMLGIYTQRFKNARTVARIFDRPEFEITYVSYFYGCATGIKGRKIA